MLLAGLGVRGDEDALPPAQFEGPLWQLVTSGRCTCWRRATPTGRSSCSRRSTPRIADARQELPRAGALHLGRAQPGAHPPSAVARAAARSPRSSTCRPSSCRAITTCRACRTAPSAPRSASPSRPATKPRATCDLPGGQSGHPLSPYYRAGFQAVGARRAAAVPARAGRTHTDADAELRRLLRLRHVAGRFGSPAVRLSA